MLEEKRMEQQYEAVRAALSAMERDFRAELRKQLPW